MRFTLHCPYWSKVYAFLGLNQLKYMFLGIQSGASNAHSTSQASGQGRGKNTASPVIFYIKPPGFERVKPIVTTENVNRLVPGKVAALDDAGGFEFFT